MTPLWFLTVLFAAFFTLFAGIDAAPLTSKPAVILVPGAYHKASVYDHVRNLLRGSGYHHVDAVNLPSVRLQAAAVDRTADISAVKAVLLARLAHGEDVVLVGNSYGATVIGEAVKAMQSKSATATNAPAHGKILGLVMLSGWIPYITEVTSPASHPDIRTVAPSWFRFATSSTTNTTNTTTSPTLIYPDGDMSSFPPSFTFYNLLPPAAAAFWTSQLGPSSFAAVNATATFIPYTGAFRCLYVVGKQDHTISPAMAQTWIDQPGAQFETLELDVDHIMMLSRPDEVVGVIRRFAGEMV